MKKKVTKPTNEQKLFIKRTCIKLFKNFEMKISYLIPLVIFVGVLVLFFFPSPEDNFLKYIITALFFITLLIFLILKSRRKNESCNSK